MKELLLLFGLTYALNGAIKETITLPAMSAENGTLVNILCASTTVMSNSSFSKWPKIWRVNQSENFEAGHMTFINDNETLRIQFVLTIDAGTYDCCLHAYAYEDFQCFSTELVIPQDGIISTLSATANSSVEGKNLTEPPLPPAWNVDLVGMDTLNAVENYTYFLRLYDMNVTDIKCIKDGNKTSLLIVSNTFPLPIYSDALIPKFTMVDFGGSYACNGTYKNGNETENIPVEFKINESVDSNLHTQFLEQELVKPYRNSVLQWTFFCSVILIALRNY